MTTRFQASSEGLRAFQAAVAPVEAQVAELVAKRRRFELKGARCGDFERRTRRLVVPAISQLQRRGLPDAEIEQMLGAWLDDLEADSARIEYRRRAARSA